MDEMAKDMRDSYKQALKETKDARKSNKRFG